MSNATLRIMETKKIIQSEINDGIICGAVLVSGDERGIRYAEAFGHAVPDKTVPMRLNTIIDIASVTKVVATATALCICRDRGLIDFDADFRAYLPAFSANLAHPITVRDLATHVSGFGHEPEKPRQYFDEDGRKIAAKLLATPPLYPPRKQYEYTCWNYLLLGMIVEQITNSSLNGFCHNEIFSPLSMRDSSLGIPATDDPQRLAKTLGAGRPGFISDFIARRIFRAGLNSGNAGAFSTGLDLAVFMQMILNHGKDIFSESSFQEISTCQEPGKYASDRTFGWVAKDSFKPPATSEHTIYHSGWSGQTILADLDRKRFAVVLTIRTGDYDRARRKRSTLISNLLMED